MHPPARVLPASAGLHDNQSAGRSVSGPTRWPGRPPAWPVDPWPVVQSFASRLDAVFCRNVLIYFDKPTQARVIDRLARVLRPGGLLFVGHAENLTEHREQFTLRGKSVYERR